MKSIFTVSILVISLLFVSGIAYASPLGERKGCGSTNVNLIVTTLSKSSGPSYSPVILTTPLPSHWVSFRVGPFAPGDSVVISYTVENTGSAPADLYSFGMLVYPAQSGFLATHGTIPQALKAGGSFTSTITVTLKSDTSLEGSSAWLSLGILGVGSRTTSTHTSTSTASECHWWAGQDGCD